MAHYIIQTIACQLFFLIVYDVFLKKQTFFNWNRAYLLITAALSFILPIIKIEMFKNIVPQQYIITLPEVVIGKQNPVVLDEVLIEGANQMSSFSWSWIYLFFMGSAFALMIFAFKIIKIGQLIKNNQKHQESNLQIVNLENSRDAFSFFNYIFIGKQLENEERETIFKHELVHVKQKHSFDMLFFEILRVLFWFNPLIYMYQNRISVVHEFSADAEAVKYNKTQYYQNLLSQVFHAKQVSFINPFFKESLIKKRIVMLQKSKSKQIQLVRYALLIPMVFGMLIYSSCSDENNANIEQQGGLDLSKYTFTSTVGVDDPKEVKEKMATQTEFIDNNIEYSQWIEMDFSKDPVFMKFSIHPKSEKLPEGYKSNEVESKEGVKRTVVFGNIGEQSPEEIDTSDYDGKEDVPFSVIDQVPVFPGCESGSSNEEKKQCMSKQINNLVAENFNTDLGNTLNLTGVVTIAVYFKIDKQGNITDAKARAPHQELADEALRVVNMLPKMMPGMHEGKAVNVPYYLPIKFKIKE
ncbi:M56 family metallopeptidase [Xanthomarina sp. F2636L]|uniref:M56 family metallopeptidase n=1 Tax=Xanthomarina sp. F2636L TaxID=2996018 RepID=UPI00225E36AE|nr:M56 family metallopeptidase [Xanthomarina sp. F2636L]MCX7550959.1 M56 family metallopeptidase [Xanthomarina sp. F2636L]